MDRRDFDTVEAWISQGHRVAVATVVATWKSSPRRAGSVMLVRDDGQVHGSVSGGCVESAVIEAALEGFHTGRTSELEFGPASPEAVWEVGLSCGGHVRVLVEPCPGQSDVPEEREAWSIAASLSRGRRGYVWTAVLGAEAPLHRVWPATEPGAFGRSYDAGWSGEEESDGRRLFVDARRPPERLVIVGGAHIAVPLVAFAHRIGFETVVIEPRATFAEPSRFDVPPDAIDPRWPQEALPGMDLDEATYAVVLTHDPKIDDTALKVLLETPAKYIGALGGRTTQEDRRNRFLAEGYSPSQVMRIRGPVGLDIGAVTPEEIALSITAEMVKVRRSG